MSAFGNTAKHRDPDIVFKTYVDSDLFPAHARDKIDVESERVEDEQLKTIKDTLAMNKLRDEVDRHNESIARLQDTDFRLDQDQQERLNTLVKYRDKAIAKMKAMQAAKERPRANRIPIYKLAKGSPEHKVRQWEGSRALILRECVLRDFPRPDVSDDAASAVTTIKGAVMYWADRRIVLEDARRTIKGKPSQWAGMLKDQDAVIDEACRNIVDTRRAPYPPDQQIAKAFASIDKLARPFDVSKLARDQRISSNLAVQGDLRTPHKVLHDTNLQTTVHVDDTVALLAYHFGPLIKEDIERRIREGSVGAMEPHARKAKLDSLFGELLEAERVFEAIGMQMGPAYVRPLWLHPMAALEVQVAEFEGDGEEPQQFKSTLVSSGGDPSLIKNRIG